MRKRDKLKNYEQANIMLEQSYLISKGLLKEEGEDKSINSFPEKIFNKITKNNGYKAKFVGDNTSSEIDKLKNEVKNSENKLAIIGAKRLGKDKEGNELAYFDITVNKNNLDEMKKIAESSLIFLPDGYQVTTQGNYFVEIIPPKQ